MALRKKEQAMDVEIHVSNDSSFSNTQDGSLHDRFWRGVSQNKAFNALLYRRILGAKSFVQDVDVISLKSLRGDLINHRMKSRITDGLFQLEYVDKFAPRQFHSRPIFVEHKFHKDVSTWIQVGEYVFVYLRDVARAIRSDSRLKQDYCVDGRLIAPTAIVFYCGYESWDFEKERIELEIPNVLEEFKANFRCEFVSVRELNANDFHDSPVLQTIILLQQAIANPKTRKEDVERIFTPVFNGDEFEQWHDVLSYCLIYWVEALEAKGIHLTTDEVFSLVDRIKDGILRKEVRMFADIWAADTMKEIRTQLKASLEETERSREEAKQSREEAKQSREEAQQSREEVKLAFAREQEAEERASQYQRELLETRRQMKTYQNKVFWDVLGARFPSIPTSTSSRITQVADYSQKLLNAVVSASSIEDFDARLDAYLATP